MRETRFFNMETRPKSHIVPFVNSACIRIHKRVLSVCLTDDILSIVFPLIFHVKANFHKVKGFEFFLYLSIFVNISKSSYNIVTKWFGDGHNTFCKNVR